MCGFLFYKPFRQHFKKSPEEFKEALDRISYRGPDAEGIDVKEDALLGHKRLSIIDTTEDANQPMVSATFPHLSIIFNGEIYNYKKLRQQLINDGIKFTSSSDTEVVLNLYATKGINALELLDGFFSFVIYDEKKEETFIARDRLGIKPFYYTIDQGQFACSSELSPLISLGKEFHLDYQSIYSLFSLSYIPAPNSIFKEVKKLLPGRCAKVKDGKIEIVQYYNLSERITPLKDIEKDEIHESLKSKLENSVRNRLVADVEVGTFLSGGVDSSIISHLAGQQQKAIRSFSIGMENKSHYLDETEKASRQAEKSGLQHTVTRLTKEEINKSVSECLEYDNEPFADTSAVALNSLTQSLPTGLKVALSGDGADELFGGYNKHRAEFFYQSITPLLPIIQQFKKVSPQGNFSRHRKVTKSLRKAKKFLDNGLKDSSKRYVSLCQFETFPPIANLLSEKINPFSNESEFFDYIDSLIPSPSSDLDGINKFLYRDTSFILPNDMLTKVDSHSMKNSIEVRVPFLDHQLVEFALSLPASAKVNSREGKICLRQAFSDIFPRENINQEKKGFEVSLRSWAGTEEGKEIISDLLSYENIKSTPLFNIRNVLSLRENIQEYLGGDHQALVWSVLKLQSFLERHKDKISF